MEILDVLEILIKRILNSIVKIWFFNRRLFFIYILMGILLGYLNIYTIALPIFGLWLSADSMKIRKNKASKIVNKQTKEKVIVEEVKDDKILALPININFDKENIPKEISWDSKYIDKDENVISVGQGNNNKKITLNIKRKPHMMISGITGSGKSILQNCITEQFLKKGYKVIGIDLKRGVAMKKFSKHISVAKTQEEAIVVLENVINEMNQRYDLIEKYNIEDVFEFNKTSTNKLAKIVVVIDEIAELLSGDKTIVNEIEQKLISIARLGRGACIHLLIATQRPSAKAISTEIRSQMSNKLCGNVEDKESSRMALGNNRALELDGTIPGRFMLNDGVDTIEFQAYFFDKEMITQNKRVKGQCLSLDDSKSLSNVI